MGCRPLGQGHRPPKAGNLLNLGRLRMQGKRRASGNGGLTRQGADDDKVLALKDMPLRRPAIQPSLGMRGAGQAPWAQHASGPLQDALESKPRAARWLRIFDNSATSSFAAWKHLDGDAEQGDLSRGACSRRVGGREGPLGRESMGGKLRGSWLCALCHRKNRDLRAPFRRTKLRACAGEIFALFLGEGVSVGWRI